MMRHMKPKSVLVLPMLLAALASLSTTGAEAAGRGTGYELEFRSRPSQYFGHSYVVARKVGGSGRVVSERLAGFDHVRGVRPIETLRGVPGEVVATRADRITPPDERYRVRVSRAQYERAINKIDVNARRKPTFLLTRQNCNTFVGNVARAAGLKAPERSFEYPREYVRQMREMNGR